MSDQVEISQRSTRVIITTRANGMVQILGTDIRMVVVENSTLTIRCGTKQVKAQFATAEEALVALGLVADMLKEVIDFENPNERGMLLLKRPCLCVLWFDQLMCIGFDSEVSKTRLMFKDGVSFCFDDDEQSSDALRYRIHRIIMRK